MQTRFITLDKDYDMFKSWWTERKHVIIPKDFLTPFGFISYIDDKPISAMWLFPVLGSKSCSIRFPISNPDSTKKERNECLIDIIKKLNSLAREMDYKYVLCTTNHTGLIDKLKQVNYVEDASNCKHMVGVL